MGSKLKPGKYDCFAAAEPDEPMFVLLGRDPLAAPLVRIWSTVRRGDLFGIFEALHALVNVAVSQRYPGKNDVLKAAEAEICADEMEAFGERRRRRDTPRAGVR